MKTHQTKLSGLVAILAVMLCSALFSGCMDGRTVAENGTELFRTIEIDGCQYLFTEISARESNNYAVAITHKGNCKNPIHHWNGGKHD